MIVRRIALALVLIGALAVDAAPPGNAVRGKAAFARYGCAACHGTVGQGSDFNAPTLAPNPKPYAFVSGYVRKPARQMPAQSPAILPDGDLADIYAYLLSIPAAKPVSVIPALAGIPTSARR